MQWREDDYVQTFGASPSTGRFLDLARDAQMEQPLDADRGEILLRLLRDMHSDTGRWSRNVIAIIDTGILHDHPLINGRVLEEVDFTGEGVEDLSGHGTLVTLIYMSDVLGRLMYDLLNVKVADGSGRGSPSNLIKGLDWVRDYKTRHPDQTIIVNISAGVYRRRTLGLLPCDGTCDVCEAAVRATRAGVVVCAAAGNTRGRTACPSTVGVRQPESGVLAITLVGAEAGIGSFAVPVDSLPIPSPRAPRVTVVSDRSGDDVVITRRSGADGYQTMLRIGNQLADSGDVEQAEKVFRHLATYADDEAWRTRGSAALGILQAANGKYDEAVGPLLAACDEKVQDSDVRAQCLYTLGIVYQHLGRTVDSERLLQSAVEIEHAHFTPLAAYALAFRRLEQGDLEKALPLLRVAERSDDPNVASSAAYNAGSVLQRQRTRR